MVMTPCSGCWYCLPTSSSDLPSTSSVMSLTHCSTIVSSRWDDGGSEPDRPAVCHDDIADRVVGFFVGPNLSPFHEHLVDDLLQGRMNTAHQQHAHGRDFGLP